MFDWLTDAIVNKLSGLKEWLYNLIYETVNDILTPVINAIADLLFSEQGLTGIFEDIYNIFLALSVGIIVIVIMVKLIQNMMDLSNGQSQTPNAEIIFRALKANVAIILLPVVLKIGGDVVYAIGTMCFNELKDTLADVITNYIISLPFMPVGPSLMPALILTIIVIALLVFFVKTCIYHVDIFFLQIFSVLAGISICTDNREFYTVWWKTFTSIIITMCSQILLISFMVTLLNKDYTATNFMLLVGSCCLIIREPAVLKNMWYSTGTKKSSLAAMGTIVRMAVLKQ